MPITSNQIVVGTTAVQVDGNATGWSHMHIKNLDATKDLYVGSGDVTPLTGFHIAKQEFFEFDIPPGDYVSLVASSGTINVAWMRVDW